MRGRISAVVGQGQEERVFADRIFRQVHGARMADEVVGADDVERFRDEESGQVRGQKRSEEHTSELQSLMRISYAVFCSKKKKSWIPHACEISSSASHKDKYVIY